MLHCLPSHTPLVLLSCQLVFESPIVAWPSRLLAASAGCRIASLSWKCCRFRCRPQLVLTTWCRVFPTRRPDTADVSATSCDVGFFFSVSYVVSLPNCRHVVVVCSLITINHSRYIQNSGTQERNERFSTLQLLASSVWRHLSPSCFCHLLVGAAQKMHIFPLVGCSTLQNG